MATPTFTKTGAKATTAVKLDQTVFGVEAKNHELLKLAYTAYLANGRENLAVAMNRGDVSGGGKKPWRQKGTGRARFGDNRVPQWRHGGVVFGPTGNENYSMTIPVKTKRVALRQALSMAANENKVRVIEAFESKDGKVAAAADLLKKMDAQGRVLLVVNSKNDLLARATRNLSSVTLTTAKYLNVYDLLNADTIVFEQPALDAVSEWLGTPARTSAKKEAK